jgi:type 1 fimbria pilin
MKMERNRYNYSVRCMFLFCLTFFSSATFATCTAPLPMSVLIPSVSIPTNLPVGQPIPGAKANYYLTVNCTDTFDGKAPFYFTVYPYANISLVPGYSDVYTTNGMGAGVGFRMRNASGTVMVPFSLRGAVGTVSYNVAAVKGANNVVAGSIELIRTSTAITAGSFSFTGYVHVESVNFANGTVVTGSTITFGYTMNSPTVAACTVTGADIPVPLQPVRVAALATVGATANPSPFNINLQCEANARPQISLTDVANPNNVSTELSLASDSTATGVAIQILANGNLVRYGPAPYYYNASSTASKNSIDLGTQSGATSIPFTARYIRTANLKPGTVKARATFTFTYQ